MATLDRLVAGRILGERYQIRELLGRGGMGEVFRAFDLKLRVDVALKAVRPDKLESEHAREALRREVRTAREVVSPNVCRIFDLVAEDGQELVSMEYVDGVTLGETLKTRGPLSLQEAREIALQFLSGLEAIHQAGLVHRDFKPENVMVTRAGRVVVMDFGLAKLQASGGGGTISGTPAYMSPEQARGDALDARADVYAAGVVLAEMLTVGGADHVEQRRALWRGLRDTPPQVPDGPWAAVLRQALSPLPDERPGSARELSRALEEVTQRLPGFETRRPYPGLSSFTEEDAEYFFGREQEVEALLKKLRRPRLLALVAPSGAGKSSFLRAGLLPALPKSWRALVTTPGSRPFQALAQALAPAFAGDAQAMQSLLRYEEPETALGLFQRFRQRHEQALLVVDQFEELFTLCPEEVQQSFSSLVSRLVLEADLHVILSLRDDFLFRCHQQKPLVSATSDLTILETLDGSALRRALVQPALSCGYRFEDEALVDEMIREVQEERGALPLLAFAASRIWEKRDSEQGRLTRAAYQEIGGVAGALAQHAEATLERIGSQRLPIVRELFRNLVTAEGTRAVRERDELLSLFDAAKSVQTQLSGLDSGRGAAASASRGEAETVLDGLLDARLLTSYERAEEGGESHRQIEIVHESLLQAWPRLQRWQTQDADGAQLRDQLRQAAHLWQDRGQPEDLLWSGTAFSDFAVWRERYPAPLTALEDEYARAMAARASRRRRLRRIAAAGFIAAAGAVATVTSVLWARSERAREAAVAEARQREAAQILSLGRLRLEDYPSAALAHAIASLERADNEPARRMAVEALWNGPPVWVEKEAAAHGPRWSPDGRWLALGATKGLTLVERSSGRRHVLGTSGEMPVGFSADGTRFVSRSQARAAELHLWSLPDVQLLRTWPPTERRITFLKDTRLLTFDFDGTKPPAARPALVTEYPIDGGPEKIYGRWSPRDLEDMVMDAAGERLYSVEDGRLLEYSLSDLRSRPRVIGRHAGATWISGEALGRLLTAAPTGEVRVWDVESGRVEKTLRAPRDSFRVFWDSTGRFIAAGPKANLSPESFVLFDLQAPRSASPVVLAQKESDFLNSVSFHPAGDWLGSGHGGTILLWNLSARRARVLHGQKGAGMALALTHDGRLVSVSDEGVARLWSLDPHSSEPVRELWTEPGAIVGYYLQLAKSDQYAVFTKRSQGQVILQPLDGSPTRAFSVGKPVVHSPRLDPSGQHVVFASFEFGDPAAASLRLLDVTSGEERVLPVPDTSGSCPSALARFGAIDTPTWLPDGRLVSDGITGLRMWDLADGSSQQVRPCRPSMDDTTAPSSMASPDGQRLVTLVVGSVSSDLYVSELASGEDREITSHGTRLRSAGLDPTGEILVTGDADGLVRVGPLSGEEPHLLYGHARAVTSVAVSPDGQWIASGSDDDTIRLWPAPEGPPLHTLPLDSLLERLRALTNLRVVPDASSPTGYKVEPGPLPDWGTAPQW